MALPLEKSIEEYRKCKQCHLEKPITEFELQYNKWRRHICKSCRVKYRLQWRQEHIDKDRKTVRKYHDKKRFGSPREIVLATFSYTCQNCNATHQIHLHIHHKDGKGRTSIIPNNKMENLEVLCKSCHHSIHAKQIRRDKYGKFTYSKKST